MCSFGITLVHLCGKTLTTKAYKGLHKGAQRSLKNLRFAMKWLNFNNLGR